MQAVAVSPPQLLFPSGRWCDYIPTPTDLGNSYSLASFPPTLSSGISLPGFCPPLFLVRYHSLRSLFFSICRGDYFFSICRARKSYRAFLEACAVNRRREFLFVFPYRRVTPERDALFSHHTTTPLVSPLLL